MIWMTRDVLQLLGMTGITRDVLQLLGMTGITKDDFK